MNNVEYNGYEGMGGDFLKDIRRVLRSPSNCTEGNRDEAAVVVILTPELELLLVRRITRQGDIWSGHWAFPGGMWREGDVNLLETARREALEEVGIDIYELDPLGWLPARGSRVKPELSVHPLLVAGARLEPRLGPELAAYSWIALDGLRVERRVVQSHTGPREVDAYVCEGSEVLVWGLTATILSDLLSLLRSLL